MVASSRNEGDLKGIGIVCIMSVPFGDDTGGKLNVEFFLVYAGTELRVRVLIIRIYAVLKAVVV